jgi:serine/threonine protein kinase
MTGKPVRPARRTVAPPANKRPSSSHQRAAVPLFAPAPALGLGGPVRASDGVMGMLGKVVDGKYGVREVIGEGGMGAVYEAEHLVLGRMVALKVLNPANSTRPEAVSRFRHEARVAGSIGHPNICEIYDVGNLEGGTPYLVMERLFGDTLADRINKEGALPFMDVLETAVQVLSGLVAAHRKGVIHRDIKPENVFLSVRPGRETIVKLLDFGISKAGSIDADLHLTRTGMVMGTPYYMAPEQARGDKIDHRVDLYATGIILYESLTGRRPYTAPNYNALLMQILSGTPRSMLEIRPAIPAAFEPIVARAMAKQAADRFQTAAEFLEVVQKLREELARTAVRPGDVARLVEAARASERPPPRMSSIPPGYDIPIHFSPSTGSGEVARSEPEAPRPQMKTTRPAPPLATQPVGPPSEMPAEQLDVPRLARLAPPPADLVADTYVDGALPDDMADLTQVQRSLPGPAARGRRHADIEPEQTIQSRALNVAEAEEIIRAAQSRKKASALPVNPLRPAQAQVAIAGLPARLVERAPIPREEGATGPLKPGEPQKARETTHPDPPADPPRLPSMLPPRMPGLAVPAAPVISSAPAAPAPPAAPAGLPGLPATKPLPASRALPWLPSPPMPPASPLRPGHAAPPAPPAPPPAPALALPPARPTPPEPAGGAAPRAAALAGLPDGSFDEEETTSLYQPRLQPEDPEGATRPDPVDDSSGKQPAAPAASSVPRPPGRGRR